ncbi:MAG TPA: sulfatase-like hydrolase/transferase [Thermoanaerobaculia bacterium]|nr:sulfatase-like hydrolase/transferase [Thermoanaerobaculia bacterium]
MTSGLQAKGGASPSPASGLSVVRRTVALAGLAVIFLGSPVAAFVRAVTVERAEAAAIGHPAGSIVPVLVADAPLVGAILSLGIAGFFLVAAGSRLRWLAPGLRVAALALFAAQVLDLAFVRLLSMRLDLGDVVRYGREGRAGLTLAAGLEPWLGSSVPPELLGAGLALLLLGWLAAVLSAPFPGSVPRPLARTVVPLSLLAVAAAAVPSDPSRFHGWAYPNVVVANLPRSTVVPYSHAYLEGAAKHREPGSVRAGKNLRANVILYIVESLSSSQSARFGGLHDFTPSLDALAGRGLSLREFVANGFTTNLGLIPLLTGRIPLPPVGDGFGESFAGFLDGLSLPRALAAHGYFTEFLSSSDLGFTRKGEWLSRIGFESIRGGRDPVFDGSPRFAFDSAPDETLVNAVSLREKELRRAKDGRPFLLVVETTTSHMPFVHPNGKDRTEEPVFRYVDAQVGRLARLLEESGFLEDGILVVTSDHRKMAPLEPEELRRWELSAFSRIPVVVLGRGLSTRELGAPFQQADLPGSLACVLTAECPVAPFRGSFLEEPPRPPACVLSPMVNDRALVYVRCGADEALVRLDGDATRVVRGRLRPADEAAVLAEIALVRTENETRPWPAAP